MEARRGPHPLLLEGGGSELGWEWDSPPYGGLGRGVGVGLLLPPCLAAPLLLLFKGGGGEGELLPQLHLGRSPPTTLEPPPPSQNPSRRLHLSSLSPPSTQELRRSPAREVLRHRHHAVVLPDSRPGLLLPLPPLDRGSEDVIDCTCAEPRRCCNCGA
jgi:hypothetical protein